MLEREREKGREGEKERERKGEGEKERVVPFFSLVVWTYPALERVGALFINSIVSHHIGKGIVHVPSVTSMVPIGDYKTQPHTFNIKEMG